MLVVKTVVHGYDVYRTIWEPHLAKQFTVIQENGSSHDRYAVAVYCHNKTPSIIVGNQLWEISKTCHYFTMCKGKFFLVK